MKTALTLIAVLLGIIISSSRIHDILAQGSSISKVEFFVIISLIIIDILIITGVIFVRKEAAENLSQAIKKSKEECKQYVSSELSIVKVYIEETKEDRKEFKEAMGATLIEIKKVAMKTNERIDKLYLSRKS